MHPTASRMFMASYRETCQVLRCPLKKGKLFLYLEMPPEPATEQHTCFCVLQHLGVATACVTQ